MTLHPPFFIGAHLAPAIRIGEATLSLVSVEYDHDVDVAEFVLNTEDFDYEDCAVKSSVVGFNNTVEIFETLLTFLFAAAESYPDGENADLFPPHVTQWANENASEIDLALSEITDEDGRPNAGLIED